MIETGRGKCVCVCVAIGDSLSLSHCCRSSIMCSHSSMTEESTHLEAAISILDTMEGVLAIAETLSCVMVCSECIQLVTEDAVNKKRCGHEERQQEWTDVKLQYLLQLRHSIVTCVCIHMMRDELESSESHDKVPTLLTALSGYLSHYQRLGELFEELSVTADQIHSLNPLIELDTVDRVRTVLWCTDATCSQVWNLFHYCRMYSAHTDPRWGIAQTEQSQCPHSVQGYGFSPV